MSACISREGEYSDHVPDKDFCCTRCFALDEAGLLARVRELEEANKILSETVENTSKTNTNMWKIQLITTSERDTALSTIANVREIHQESACEEDCCGAQPMCSECGVQGIWPCETIRALGSVPSTGEGNE